MDSKVPIETIREGDEIIVRASYWTPEWTMLIETIRWPMTLIGTLGPSLIVWQWLAATHYVATSNEAILAGGIASAGAFALSWGINNILARWRGGYGLSPRGRAHLTVRLSRGTVTWEGGGKRGAIDREEWSIRFVPRPERRGKAEERDAASGRNAYPVSYANRDAWEIWLQAGEHFFALASVSSEADADAIVRRLQACDLAVTRRTARSRGQGQASL